MSDYSQDNWHRELILSYRELARAAFNVFFWGSIAALWEGPHGQAQLSATVAVSKEASWPRPATSGGPKSIMLQAPATVTAAHLVRVLPAS